MNIKEAASYVLPAVGTMNDFSYVHFGGGRMWASDSSVAISAPVFLGSQAFSVNGKDLRDSLSKLDDPTAEFSTDALVLKSGRARVRIKSREQLLPEPSFEGEEFDRFDGWLQTLLRLAEITDPKSSQPWLKSVMIYTDAVIAVGPRGELMAWDDSTYLGGKECLLPSEALDALKSRGEVSRVVLNDGAFMALEWPDGVRFRSQLLAGDMPRVVYNKRGDWKPCNIQMSEVFIKSALRACSLTGDAINLNESGLYSKSDTVDIKDEDGGGVFNSAAFNPAGLASVLKFARKTNGEGYPMSWEGSGLKGLLNGVRT